MHTEHANGRFFHGSFTRACRVMAAVSPEPSMQTHVEFRSDSFPPYVGEENEVNPGRFGKRVAGFLVGGLKRTAFEPLEPTAEDWGWAIPIKNQGFDLWIGCGNYDEYPDGCVCFIEPHQPTIRRWLLWTVDTSTRITALQVAIDQLLTDNPHVRKIR